MLQTSAYIIVHVHFVCAIFQADDGLEIRALNFQQLHKVLSCAGDKKLKEAQLCLEGTAQWVRCSPCVVTSQPRDDRTTCGET